MSDQLREQASWRKGKTPVIVKYQEEHRKIMSAVAGRGFLSYPGHAYDAENSIELNTKLILSDLNLKILSETIERELKQTGIDYDQSYRSALITWEIEKQTLLNAWEQEYAGIKQDMANKEEYYDRLAIAVSERGAYLITQKTSIQLQAEAYKLELAELDGTTAPYEVQLANAKLITANKKLELIPILQEIIEKEQSLLEKEQEKTDEYTNLMTAEKAVADKKQTLIPTVQELTGKIEERTAKIPLEIQHEQDMLAEKSQQLEYYGEKVAYEIGAENANIETAEKELDLAEAKRNLSDAQFENNIELIAHELANDQTVQDAVVSNFSDIQANENETQQSLLEKQETLHQTQLDTSTDHQTAIIEGRATSDTYINNQAIRAQNEVADINAVAELTAKLTHLLG